VKRMTGDEIRRSFLDFFARKGHEVVPSAPLVPAQDPTLLFTNAGMVQFKDTFLGREKRPYSRAATSQRCLRVSGKHNDLEEVGRTARHNTFFEMLGNFSFVDYFKREAIGYAWEFLTGTFELDPDRMWITVFREDDESAELWQEVCGVPPERIVRLGEKDNFWGMGDTGPCGPNSEIIYDMGEEYRCGADECFIGACDCDRWLELWNLVFMQFDRDKAGNMTPLPRPGVDTGMGLERAAAVLQGKDSIFDTDLVRPLIDATEELSGREYDPGPAGMPFRVIADHARACVFLIADGIVPSNEGRGYVLRRVLRRSVRYGKLLGLERPFMHHLVPVVVGVMKEAMPELEGSVDLVSRAVLAEEERFRETLQEGVKRAEEIVERARSEGRREISGREAFVLYDTFGFPLDLTEDIAEESGLKVDRKGFEEAMAEQKRRARKAREQAGGGEVERLAELAAQVEGGEFVGYDELERDARVAALFRRREGKDPERVREVGPSGEAWVILDRSPFFGESGGQVGDRGILLAGGAEVRVVDSVRLPDGSVAQAVSLDGATLREGDEVRARVDEDRRAGAARHHTATHLLHAALKEVIGEHANQSGSLVAPDRLRFDFTHFAALEPDEVSAIEGLVNRKVLEMLPVRAYRTSYDEARAEGAIALFGEKYGDRVRVVEIEGFSKELCGGTHLVNTGRVGAFKIISESSIGSGLRRVEALAGPALLSYYSRREELLEKAAALLKVGPEQVPARVRGLLEEQKARDHEIESLRRRLAASGIDSLLEDSTEVAGIRIVVGEVQAPDMDALRSLADRLKDRLESGVIVLGSAAGDRAQMVAAVVGAALERGIHAGKLLGEVAKIVGGGGGGRPDMAQAGGKEPGRLSEALDAARAAVERLLSRGGREELGSGPAN